MRQESLNFLPLCNIRSHKPIMNYWCAVCFYFDSISSGKVLSLFQYLAFFYNSCLFNFRYLSFGKKQPSNCSELLFYTPTRISLEVITGVAQFDKLLQCFHLQKEVNFLLPADRCRKCWLSFCTQFPDFFQCFGNFFIIRPHVVCKT